MRSQLKEHNLISREEYLEGETVSEIRHEYIDGLVYAMAGGTLNHNTIALNVAGALNDALDGSACRPYMADVKVMVKTLASESFYYPDVVVSCAADDKDPQFLEKPTTIIEVLSDSTERIDRNEKFLAYKNLSSLEEYVLISQNNKVVTVARRENNWQAEILKDEFSLKLSCNDTELSSAQIYRNVEL